MSVIEMFMCDCCGEEIHRSPPSIAALESRKPYVRETAHVAVGGREFEVTITFERTDCGTERVLHLCLPCRLKLVETYLRGYGVASVAPGRLTETGRTEEQVS